MIVDPAEEKLRSEFHETLASYIPLHSVIRVDYVKRKGVSKITETSSSSAKVRYFPNNIKAKNQPENN